MKKECSREASSSAPVIACRLLCEATVHSIRYLTAEKIRSLFLPINW